MNVTWQKSLKLQIPPKEIETPYCVNFKPHTCASPKIGGEGMTEKHQALVTSTSRSSQASCINPFVFCNALTYVTLCGSDLVVLLSFSLLNHLCQDGKIQDAVAAIL